MSTPSMTPEELLSQLGQVSPQPIQQYSRLASIANSGQPQMPQLDPSAQPSQPQQGGIRNLLSSMFQNFVASPAEDTGKALKKAGNWWANLDNNPQSRAQTAYTKTLADAQRNNIDQSQPVPIPDNVALVVGLPKGSTIPKAAFGQVMGSYLRMIGQNNKPSAAGDKEKYMGILQKRNLGVQTSPEEDGFAKAYETTVSLPGVKGAEARGQAFGNIKVKTLYDTKGKQMLAMNANEWNAKNAAEPGRYIDPQNSREWLTASAQARGLGSLASQVMQVPDGNGGTQTVTKLDALRERMPGVSNLNFERVLNKQVLMDDVVGAFQAVKQYTHVLNNGHNSNIAAALAEPEHTLMQYAQSGAIGNLNDEEQKYVINLIMAREAAGSMRMILSSGQSSDMQRRLILASLPNASTPDSKYADNQIDAALGIVKRVAPSVPKGVVSRDKGPAATHRFNPATGRIEVISNGR